MHADLDAVETALAEQLERRRVQRRRTNRWAFGLTLVMVGTSAYAVGVVDDVWMTYKDMGSVWGKVVGAVMAIGMLSGIAACVFVAIQLVMLKSEDDQVPDEVLAHIASSVTFTSREARCQIERALEERASLQLAELEDAIQMERAARDRRPGPAQSGAAALLRRVQEPCKE